MVLELEATVRGTSVKEGPEIWRGCKLFEDLFASFYRHFGWLCVDKALVGYVLIRPMLLLCNGVWFYDTEWLEKGLAIYFSYIR